MKPIRWPEMISVGEARWIRFAVAPHVPTDAYYRVVQGKPGQPEVVIVPESPASIVGSIIGCLFSPTRPGSLRVEFRYTIQDQRFRASMAVDVEM
jgi:hypothetical protein